MKWLREKSIKVAARVQSGMVCERGDTNFISVLIILAIVIILAGIFIGFKDQIVDQVNGIVNGFTIKASESPMPT